MSISLLTLTAGKAELEALLDAELEANGGEITTYIDDLLTAIGLTDEQTETAIAQKIDGYYAIISELNAEAGKFKQMKDNMASKQKRCENAGKAIKTRLQDVMELRGISKIKGEYCTASLRNNPASVDITDESELTAPYMGIVSELTASLPAWMKVSVDIDKKALKSAIEGGYPVKGAEITQGKSVTIK